MNKKIIFYIFCINIVFSQHIIQTREYTYYKTSDISSIDFSELITNLNGDYLIKVVGLTNLQYNQTKNVFIQNCELKFKLESEISKNDINISKCNDELFFENIISINAENSVITVNSDKYNHLSCSLTFWITGKFDDNIKSGNINTLYDGILREWYESGVLFIEYNYNDGKKHGVQKRWHENNSLDIKYYFNKGKLHGEQLRWFPNGQMKSTTYYINDQLDGIVKEWHDNGQLKEVRAYDYDVLVEIVESYDKHGNPN